jgi:heptose I phosphotransferase
MKEDAGTLWTRLTRSVRILVHREEWRRFAGDDFAERIMSVVVTDRFHQKQGRSTGRWVLRADGKMLVVYLKRHRRLPWWRRLLAVLLPQGGWSPAMAEWRHLEWAWAHGIPVPRRVAVGEFIGPGLHFESFLAIEELTGFLPLHEAIPHAQAEHGLAEFEALKRQWADDAARLSRTLHAAHRYHKDLYLCHFFVPTDALTPGPMHLIDLHRLGHHPWTGWRWRVKDLAQLLYSSRIPGVTDRDRLRFFKAYLQMRKLDAAARRLMACVIAKAERYRRHNQREDGGRAQVTARWDPQARRLALGRELEDSLEVGQRCVNEHRHLLRERRAGEGWV